jgi:hypothetical protein
MNVFSRITSLIYHKGIYHNIVISLPQYYLEILHNKKESNFNKIILLSTTDFCKLVT